MSRRSFVFDALLVLFIMVEILSVLSFNKGVPGNLTNELRYTLSSIAIGALLFFKYYNRVTEIKPACEARSKRKSTLVLAGLSLLAIVALALACRTIFKAAPYDDASLSDVIPTLQTASQRLIQGEFVYKTIDKWGYALPLTYLPMQWLPYTIAELAGFDYRWIALGIFVQSSLILVFRLNARNRPRAFFTLAMIACFTYLLLQKDPGIVSTTVELMVAGYYILLIIGLCTKNPWLRGAAIALCLLSRYSLVLWLPLWALVEFSYGDRKSFFKACLSCAALVAGLYIIPFLSRDWTAFGRAYNYYTVAALGEWDRVDGNGVPFQLDQGVGFARMFYLKLHSYSIPDRLKSLQKVHLLLSLGSVVAMSGIYFLVRRRIDPKMFLLATFKIYLSIFLAFIQVPYCYLMMTAIAVSIAIFAESGRFVAGGRLHRE